MCFRPPSAEAGEFPCPHCYVVCRPNAEGNCPECGEPMSASSDGDNSSAPVPSAPKPPVKLL